MSPKSEIIKNCSITMNCKYDLRPLGDIKCAVKLTKANES